MRSISTLLSVSFALASIAYAADPNVQTVTVDDANPAIVYSIGQGDPNLDSTWEALTVLPCNMSLAGCRSLPSAAKLENSTVHEGFNLARASLTFTGVDVAAYFVMETIRTTNVSFYLDGVLEGNYVTTGEFFDTNDTYVYNYRAFKSTGLNNSQHQLDIVGGIDNTMWFDYIQYNKTDGNTTSTTGTTGTTGTNLAADHPVEGSTSGDKKEEGTIIGSAIGGVIIVGIVAGLAFFIYRRVTKSKGRKGPRVDLGSDTLPLNHNRESTAFPNNTMSMYSDTAYSPVALAEGGGNRASVMSSISQTGPITKPVDTYHDLVVAPSAAHQPLLGHTAPPPYNPEPHHVSSP